MGGRPVRLVLAAGTTRTARIDGISAAGADPDLTVHTPSADAEILTYGRIALSPVVPVSPGGCPTPAVISRAVRELVGFETTVVDAGLAKPTGAPTVDLGADPGADVRREAPVPAAEDLLAAARRFGRALPDDRLLLAETIPGGTTTALGVLTALGERERVSSSLPENPMALKREVVAEALDASDLRPGDAAGDPAAAIRAAGDPVLATVAGLALGALDGGAEVVLAGGTQLLAAAALVRHAGADDPLSLATTSFLADDPNAAVRETAADLDVAVAATDPGFDGSDHPGMAAYVRGEAKEGVGAGGALALAEEAGVGGAALRDRIASVYDRLLGGSGPEAGSTATGGAFGGTE